MWQILSRSYRDWERRKYETERQQGLNETALSVTRMRTLNLWTLAY